MVNIIKYPDGSSYPVVEQFPTEFIFKINSYEDLWHLNQIRDVYRFNGKNATVIIPNILDGQADRRFNSNESANLKLVCKFINAMKWKTVVVFHPHNAEVVEALLDNVEIIDNSSIITRVLNSISDEGYKNKDLVVLLPDGGAYKWGVKLMDKLGFTGTVLACAKNRTFENGKSKLIQQLPDFDFEGKDILIIDDLCIYGGTFKGLVNLLKTKNCGKLYLAISHMTIANLGDDPITNYFDTVFTTNSKFDRYYTVGEHIVAGSMYKTNEPENLKVIKLFNFNED